MESCRFCCVSERVSGGKYVCYTRREHGGFKISVTDAADVWSADLTDPADALHTSELGLEDFCRSLSSGDVCLELKDGHALLRSASGSNLLDLTKMAAATAKQEVKQLLFKMADSLTERVLTSPKSKNQNQHRAIDLEQNATALVTTKKRVPGFSLINPGTKRKRDAMGVAFDD